MAVFRNFSLLVEKLEVNLQQKFDAILHTTKLHIVIPQNPYIKHGK